MTVVCYWSMPNWIAHSFSPTSGSKTMHWRYFVVELKRCDTSSAGNTECIIRRYDCLNKHWTCLTQDGGMKLAKSPCTYGIQLYRQPYIEQRWYFEILCGLYAVTAIMVVACLRHKLFSLARTLVMWVRIPLKEWMSVCAFILWLCYFECR
jgi:hypothetical protein